MSRSTKSKADKNKTSKAPPFDKYALYKKAVQSPEGDVVFLRKVYQDIRGKVPTVLREDFCGTGLLCTEWIKLDPRHEAFGVDLDPEPIEYGRLHDQSRLKPDQLARLQLLEKNVMDPNLPKADLSVALNFSYFLFKTRPLMKSYFQNVYSHLKTNGVAVFDIFGGSQCQGAIEDRTKHKGFTYYWDQTGYDPVSNGAVFHIHFRVGAKKYEKVFTYDWRLWSIPELRDILEEVGFKKTHIYWEGTAKDGTGNGVFKKTDVGEECLSWIAYIVAEK